MTPTPKSVKEAREIIGKAQDGLVLSPYVKKLIEDDIALALDRREAETEARTIERCANIVKEMGESWLAEAKKATPFASQGTAKGMAIAANRIEDKLRALLASEARPHKEPK